MYVTIDTIVPDKPRKVLQEPDDVAYHMKVVEIDEQIEKLNLEIKEIDAHVKKQSSDMIDGQQARNPIRSELSGHFAELKTYTDKKRVIFANIEKLANQLKDLDRERDRLRKSVHQIYNDPEKL